MTGLLTSERDLKNALEGVDTLFHFLEQEEPGPGGRGRMKSFNVQGTATLLKIARMQGVRQVVFKSDWQVYGPAMKPLVAGETPLRPRTPLGRDKKKAEGICLAPDKQSDMIVTVLRPAPVLGPGLDNRLFLLIFFLSLGQEEENRSVIIEGGENKIEFVSADDLARAALLAMDSRAGGVFNISGGNPVSTGEIIGRCKNELNPSMVIKDISWNRAKMCSVVSRLVGLHYLSREHLQLLRYNLLFDTTSSRNKLGWEPSQDSPSVFIQTARWYRDAHPAV
jgi:nucleoside-diphosphate-sugar epimerase